LFTSHTWGGVWVKKRRARSVASAQPRVEQGYNSPPPPGPEGPTSSEAREGPHFARDFPPGKAALHWNERVGDDLRRDALECRVQRYIPGS